MKLPVGYVAGEGLKSHNYSGYGQRLMENMGWAKGRGLGKEEQGITEHIKVKKKDDTLGVGVTNKYDWTDKWWENAFNNVASKFAAPAEIRNTAGASSSSSSSSDSDSDSGKKKAELKKKKLTKKKGKRSSSSSSSSSDSDSSSSSDSDSDGGVKVHRDGTLAAGASNAELAILAELQKDKWGRWGGRDGKMARVRAMEEKMAAEARAKLLSSTLHPSDSPSNPSAGKKDGAKSAAAAATNAKFGTEVLGKDGRKRWIIEVDVPPQKRPRVEAPPTPTPKEGWWGTKLGFVSAGFMGGADRDMEHKREEFTENDQERVYMAAHAAKTSGKGGLGIGKPVGESKLGKDFVGAKKKFGDDDEDEEAPAVKEKEKASTSSDSSSSSESEDEEAKKKAEKKKKKAEKKRKREEEEAKAKKKEAKKQKKEKRKDKKEKEAPAAEPEKKDKKKKDKKKKMD